MISVGRISRKGKKLVGFQRSSLGVGDVRILKIKWVMSSNPMMLPFLIRIVFRDQKPS
jgi:hypothetical protein